MCSRCKATGRQGINRLALIHAVKSLHQPTFLAGSFIFMENAFCRGFIQGPCGNQGCLASVVHIALLYSQSGFLQGGPGTSPVNTIMVASLFVLTIALDLRFNICQGLTSNNFLDFYQIFTSVNST